MEIGDKLIIRTVTHYWTGSYQGSGGVDGLPSIMLGDAAWIGDTGRWSHALKTGELSEVEPVDGDVHVSCGAIVDICEWRHPLPMDVR